MVNVLIIDDDHDILESLHCLLEEEGYHVKSSSKGQVALDLIHAEELPHILILDMFLSGYDGRQIAQVLKHHPRTRTIPIIMISAHLNAEKTVKQVGVDAFLAKPFNISEFLDSVKQHAENSVLSA